MTDPQNAGPTQPPAPQPYDAAPPAAQPYNSAPPSYSGAPAAPAAVPGRTLGIVAFVLSLIFFLGISVLLGLILGIVALVQSKKAGHKNGFALAAIIISSILIVVGFIVTIVLVATFGAAFAEVCSQLGPGVWELEGGGTITCS